MPSRPRLYKPQEFKSSRSPIMIATDVRDQPVLVSASHSDPLLFTVLTLRSPLAASVRAPAGRQPGLSGRQRVTRAQELLDGAFTLLVATGGATPNRSGPQAGLPSDGPTCRQARALQELPLRPLTSRVLKLLEGLLTPPVCS